MTMLVSKNKPHGDHTTKTFAIINIFKTSFGWLKHLGEVLEKADMNKDDCLTWVLYHAALQSPPRDPTTNIAQLLKYKGMGVNHGSIQSATHI